MGTRLLALSGTSGDGILVLFDHTTLECLAIVDDVLLHEYRTGAPAGLASRYMARPDSRVLGCIGSSGIARGSVRMVCCAIPTIERVLVYSPHDAHRAHFAEQMSAELNLPVVPVASAETAAGEADVLITATDADRPVVAAEAIRAGTHINAMARNEIPMDVLRGSRNVTGWRTADREIDPPMRDPVPEAWISGELADLVSGSLEGRTDDRTITAFLGGGGPCPMWDVQAASTMFEAAKKMGLGTPVNISG
jgi:ornithine cyclodeaminase/alanine dehydrogenase-like protein (mu-crystallin family)